MTGTPMTELSVPSAVLPLSWHLSVSTYDGLVQLETKGDDT